MQATLRLLSSLMILHLLFSLSLAGDTLPLAKPVPLSELPEHLRLGYAPSCAGVWQNPYQDIGLQGGELLLEAQSLAFLLNRRAEAKGQVRVQGSQYQLYSPHLTLDIAEDRLQSFGPSLLQTPEFQLQAMQLEQQRGQRYSTDGQFVHFASQLSGTADDAELRTDGSMRLQRLTFSRCMPEQMSWQVKARQVDIDPEKGQAIVRYGTLYLGRVPVFWTPYLSIPLDDRRKTGLLTPRFSLSPDIGLTSYQQALYLNLASHFDATLEYQYYADAGQVIGSQWRHLNAYGTGQLDTAWLMQSGNPRLDAQQQAYTRGYARWQWRQRQAPWSLQMDVATASDEFWQLDFADANDPQPRQTQYARVQWQEAGRQASLLWQQQQLVKRDPVLNDRRYQLWPQLTLRQGQQWSGLRTWQQSQLTHFRHANHPDLEPDAAAGQQLASLRHQLQLGHEWAWRPSYGLSRVRLDLMANQYQLYHQADDPQYDPQHAWAVPMLSLEQQLMFDRPFQVVGQPWQHSLVPNVQLHYVPLVEEQLQHPVFDSAYSSGLDANYRQALRFSGSDRYGDTLRLHVGLGSQWRQLAGPLSLNSQLSQGLLLQQQRLQLNSLSDVDPDAKPQLQDLHLNNQLRMANNWTLASRYRWQVEDREQLWRSEFTLAQQQYSLQWRGSNRGLLNLEWQQQQQSEQQQARVDLLLPWQRRYGLYASGQWQQKQEEDWRLRQVLFGLELDDCCWHSRVIAFHQPLYEDEAEVVRSKTYLGNGLRLEFNLKGLAGRNDGIDNLLNSVPGYRGRLLQTQ